MLDRWSLILIYLSIICFHISFIHSTPILSQAHSHITDENDDQYQNAYSGFIYFIKTILNEKNAYEQTALLNQLREYLNRMCIGGMFGPSRADACQRVVDIVHQNYVQNHMIDDEANDALTETHDRQKRFFCNGFTGCRNMAV